MEDPRDWGLNSILNFILQQQRTSTKTWSSEFVSNLPDIYYHRWLFRGENLKILLRIRVPKWDIFTTLPTEQRREWKCGEDSKKCSRRVDTTLALTRILLCNVTKKYSTWSSGGNGVHTEPISPEDDATGPTGANRDADAIQRHADGRKQTGGRRLLDSQWTNNEEAERPQDFAFYH